MTVKYGFLILFVLHFSPYCSAISLNFLPEIESSCFHGLYKIPHGISYTKNSYNNLKYGYNLYPFNYI